MKLKCYKSKSSLLRLYISQYCFLTTEKEAEFNLFDQFQSEYLYLILSKNTSYKEYKYKSVITSSFEPNKFSLEINKLTEIQPKTRQYIGAINEIIIFLKPQQIKSLLPMTLSNVVIKDMKFLGDYMNPLVEVLFCNKITIKQKVISLDQILIDYLFHIQMDGIQHILKKNGVKHV
jgi:hypothetical protein